MNPEGIPSSDQGPPRQACRFSNRRRRLLLTASLILGCLTTVLIPWVYLAFRLPMNPRRETVFMLRSGAVWRTTFSQDLVVTVAVDTGVAQGPTLNMKEYIQERSDGVGLEERIGGEYKRRFVTALPKGAMMDFKNGAHVVSAGFPWRALAYEQPQGGNSRPRNAIVLPWVAQTRDYFFPFRPLPTRPLWPGLIGNAALWSLVWFAMVVAFLRLPRWRRNRQGRCESCGYDLRGITADVCPECGHRVAGCLRAKA